MLFAMIPSFSELSTDKTLIFSVVTKFWLEHIKSNRRTNKWQSAEFPLI